MFILGRMYYQGDLTGRDLEKARYRLSCSHNMAATENNAGSRGLAEKYLARLDQGLLPHR